MSVTFGASGWEAVRGSGAMAVDMHFHTSCSDSFTDVRSAVRLAGERGVGLAVTDHNLISSLIAIKDMDAPVPVIPGMEVSTSDGPHVLVYFYDLPDLERFWYRCIRPRMQECLWLALRDCPTCKLLDMLERENCVVSAAHPMGYFNTNKGVEICIRKGYLDASAAGRLDAYEVMCGGMTRESNLHALESADRHGLGYTGGTDGHTLGELGNVVTVSSTASDVDGFLNDVLRRRVDIIGVEKSVPDKVRMASASLSKFILHSPSALRVQTNQAVQSADRGARRAAAAVSGRTGGWKEAVSSVEDRLRELGKRRSQWLSSSGSSGSSGLSLLFFR